MNSSRYLLIRYTFTIAALCLFGCNPPEECSYGNITTDKFQYLSSYNKANAYTGYDTLVFVSGSDTSRLYGQGKVSKFVTTTSVVGQNSNCSVPAFKYHDETLTLNFLGSGKLSRIVFLNKFGVGESSYININEFSTGFNAPKLNNDAAYNTKVIIDQKEYMCIASQTIPRIFFHKQHGLIRIDSINGQNWTIINLP